MHKFYKPFETYCKNRNSRFKIESELGGDNPVSYRSSRDSMNNRLLGLRRRSILFALAAFLLVIFSSTVYAACVTPTRGMTITKDTTFCAGTYNFNGLDGGVIVIGASRITLDCGNAVFVGNNAGIGLRTSSSPAVNNVIVKNCEFRNYDLPVYILGQTTLNANHITLDNIKVRGGRDVANILVVGCDDCTFKNIDSSDAKNLVSDPLPPHGIYISGGPNSQTGNNIIIENSKFERNAASGIRISDIDGRYHNNLIVRNNIIDNNVDSGLAINACSSCQVTGNKIYANGNRGISIGTSSITESKSITISGNTIYDNSFDDFILWGSNGVTIKNNIYTKGVLSLSLRTESVKSYSIEESVNKLNINYHSTNNYAADAIVTMSYTGLKKVKFTNNDLTFNFVAPYNDVKNTVTGSILSSNLLSYNTKIYANQKIEVGNFVADPVIVNQAPLAPVVTMTSSDNTINSDINCAAYINDVDSNSLNTNIQWFKNNVIEKSISIDNKLPKTTVSNTLAKTALATNDKIYCRARSYDGEKFGEWTNSQTITITSTPTNALPVINSISAYSYDSTVNNDVSCMLNINDPNNNQMTVTLHWYKNGVFFKSVTKYNQKSGEITEILSKDNLNVDDTWQCRSRLYDGLNYSSWKPSNIITIQSVPIEEPRKSGGGGGGGSSRSSTPIQVASPVVVVEEPIVEESPTSFESSQSEDTSIAITTQSFDVPEEPVQEENSITGDVVLEDTQPGNGLAIILFGVMISGLLIFTYRKQIVITTDKYLPVVKEKVLLTKEKLLLTKEKIIPVVGATTDKVVFIVKKHLAVKTDQKIVYYILKKLNDGYSYDAIGEVLNKKGYSNRSVKYHTKVLMANGYQPFIKYPGPQNYSIPQSKKAKLINDIQEYTRIHIHEGFRLDEIKQVLLYSGHPWDIIEEAIHG